VKSRHALLVGFGIGAVAILALSGFLGRQHVIELAGRVAGGASPPAESPTPAISAVPSPTSQPQPKTPGARAGAVMVYDPENLGLILFGGSTTIPQPDGHNLGVPLDDTWLWNGASWRKLDVAGPPARGGAMAAYDSARHEIVLFGGAGEGGVLNDTWTWDGSGWQLREPVHQPQPRYRAGAAFDEMRGVLVMVGGEGEGAKVYTSTTWTWDGIDWTMHSPAVSPTARRFAGMAYSAATGTTVLYGGTWAGRHLSDTWLWDGVTWRQGPPGPAPGWASLTYDASTQELVGFIYRPGEVGSVRLITWDGARWAQAPGDGQFPGPRAQAAVAYDGANANVVVYGGMYIDPVPYSETWIWSGAGWSLWEPAVGA
jgi:Kelch motif